MHFLAQINFHKPKNPTLHHHSKGLIYFRSLDLPIQSARQSKCATDLGFFVQKRFYRDEIQGARMGYCQDLTA